MCSGRSGRIRRSEVGWVPGECGQGEGKAGEWGRGGWVEFVGGGDGGGVIWWGMKQRVTERLSVVLMVVMGVSGCRQVMPDDAETSPVGPSVLSDREVAAALGGRVDPCGRPGGCGSADRDLPRRPPRRTVGHGRR